MSELGIVAAESSTDRFPFFASRPVRVGEYVVVETPDGEALGFVEKSFIRSDLMATAKNYIAAMEASRASSANPRDKGYEASARVLGLVDRLRMGIAFMPSVPPVPGTTVAEASPELLSGIFSRTGRNFMSVGGLLRNPGVSVSVDVNMIASRHLAILATTGSGKSNLLALIAKRVSNVNGTMVIFDYHGEYSELRIGRASHVQPRINPRTLEAEELAELLDVSGSASRQRSLLARVLTNEIREAQDFWEALNNALNGVINAEESDADDVRRARRLIEIIERAVRRKGRILDPDIGEPLDQVRPNYINVIDMAELTESQASIIISYYLSGLLEDRKQAQRQRMSGGEGRVRFPSPVIVAIEEAHAFLPADKQAMHEASSVASKVAREGRKFGLSLIIVSQRPSRVDQDILSQMGSLAVMRITQPKDQNYILESSELISEDLAGYLPSMNVGEAILLGQWVGLPSIVKVDKVEEKLTGADIDAVKQWSEGQDRSGIAREDTSEFMKGV
ncbi:MAG: ATP-binding protein [Nitrososphaerota archaeon]|jgi:DNA helicase HerA-like ATPase|nr:ATP-binding protein [Nitrososphaerota archaeon]